MPNQPTITGLNQIKANMAAKKAELGGRAEVGLKLAGLYLQGQSQNIVPVDTGFLKASAITRAAGRGWNTLVTVAYTALYAMFVHENVEMKLRGQPRPGGKGHYWDPQGRAQAKFLEAPSRDVSVRKRMLQIFQNTLKGGGA